MLEPGTLFVVAILALSGRKLKDLVSSFSFSFSSSFSFSFSFLVSFLFLFSFSYFYQTSTVKKSERRFLALHERQLATKSPNSTEYGSIEFGAKKQPAGFSGST